MKQVWDNSNIIESYPDVCSPLTFSFARYVYREVYTQSALLFGASQKEAKNLFRTYDSMLGYIDGKFYYNLENWLVLISHLPGFNRNQKLLQEMMGVKEEDYIKIPEVKISNLLKFKVLTKFIWYHFCLDRSTQKWVDNFNRNFEKIKQRLEEPDLSSYQALEIYFSIEKRFLYQWKIPILNDFAVMIYTGILKKCWQLAYKKEIDSTALGIGIYGNAKMVVALREMAERIQKDQRIKESIKKSSLSVSLIEDVFKNNKEIKKELSGFIEKYGLRNGNNLKLETPNLSEEPEKIAGLIKQYIEIDNKKAETQEETRDNNILLGPLLKRSRAAIRNREEMRVKRSQVFGAVRKCFLAIAREFKEKDLIENESDIFFLEVEEVFGVLRGLSTTRNLKKLVKIRKEEQIEYLLSTTQNHFKTESYPQFEESRVATKRTFTTMNEFSGKGNYPGKIEGEVIIMKNLNFETNVKDKILVCKYTDPNWVPLLGVVKGLVVERGGLLSHAAIVSRELKVPSIIGIENATEQLKDGQKISLDSVNGTIKLL